VARHELQLTEHGIKLALAAYPDTGLGTARETNRGSAVSAAVTVQSFVAGMAPVTRIARRLWNTASLASCFEPKLWKSKFKSRLVFAVPLL
jgi:hypothetical protein